jgi:hypothetical protein
VSKSDLRIDWATHEAAKYACKNWHYSGCLPSFKRLKVGAWESEKFIGVVLFGQGATPEYGKRFQLPITGVCELTRVALSKHTVSTSRILSIALKFLKKQCPDIRLVISFADSSQGHHGGIYQATNWIYDGTVATHGYRVNGKIEHPKTLHSRYGKGGQSIPWLKKHVDKNAERVVAAIKHRYLMPLDDEMRKRIEPLRKPYPKRVTSAESGTPGIPVGKGRCNSDRNALDIK